MKCIIQLLTPLVLFFFSSAWGHRRRKSSHSITQDPLMINFQNDGSGNYRLSSSSPAIDSGSTKCADGSSSCLPEKDFSGWLRPQGSAIDLGPFEFH